jgi:hypothetical protein
MLKRAAFLTAIFLASTGSASAGVYADDLAKCLVKSTTAADQTDLVAWVFAAMSLHPAVHGYASIDDGRRAEMDRKTAQLMQRLLTADCRKEAVDALKYEGTGTIETSFGVLGQVAMRGIMTDPGVEKGLSGLAANLDEEKLIALFGEAGIKVPSTAGAPAKPAQ